MAKRNEQKIKDKEIEIILDGLKEDLTEVDRVSHPTICSHVSKSSV